MACTEHDIFMYLELSSHNFSISQHSLTLATTEVTYMFTLMALCPYGHCSLYCGGTWYIHGGLWINGAAGRMSGCSAL